MDDILALLYIVTCLILIGKMFFGRSVLDCHLGTIAVFSLGYYPLPVLAKSVSALDYYREDEIFSALLIHWLFLICLILGAAVGRRIFAGKKTLRMMAIDDLMFKWRLPLSVVAFLIYLTYFSTQSLTSYSADDFEAFFNDRGQFFAIIAAFGTMSLAYLAIALAASWRVSDKKGLLIIGGMFAFCVWLTLTLGQRLIIITPIFMLFASLYTSGQKAKALRLFAAGIAALLILSPLAVYIRQTQYQRIESGSSSVPIGNFTYEGGFLESSFKSIVDRADLVYVTLNMKNYIDATTPPGPIYYLSVILIPVPRAIIPWKPYLLSSDGTPSGELSIWAWQTLKGGIGSLTAFGGLYAYREGGWLWIFINGFATGMFFAFLARWMGSGGITAHFFYVNLFVALAVAKVPPSFFEALAAFMGLLPFILVAGLLSYIRVRLKRKRKMVRRGIGKVIRA